MIDKCSQVPLSEHLLPYLWWILIFFSDNSGTDGTMPVTLPEWIEGVVFIEEDGAKRILWEIPKRQHLRWGLPAVGSGSAILYTFF